MALDSKSPAGDTEYMAWVRGWLDDDALRDLPGGELDPLFVAGAVTAYMPRSRRHYTKILHSLHELQELQGFTADEVAKWIVGHFERDGKLVIPIVLRPRR